MILGHVYVVPTALTKPPKDKLTICVCIEQNLFMWFNTRPRSHGHGQLFIEAAEHPALTHDCYLDCSRVTSFPPRELAAALQRDRISAALAVRIIDYLNASPPKTLPGRHRQLIIDNLRTLR